MPSDGSIFQLRAHSFSHAAPDLCSGSGSARGGPSGSDHAGPPTLGLALALLTATAGVATVGGWRGGDGGIGGGLRLACLAVRDAYQSTRLFREVRLRAALLDREGADLKLLRGEEVYNRYPGAWNLSGEAGNLGTFLVTNVRVVWYANLSPNLYNISLPYIQIRFLSGSRVPSSASSDRRVS